MGVRKQIGDRQLVRAARQAVTAALAAARIDRFPPVTGAADQVVALSGEFQQVMATSEIAQPEQFRNRYLIGAGQTGSALTTVIWPKPMFTLPLEVCEHPLLLHLKRAVAGCKGSSQFQISCAPGSHRQGADAGSQQKAVGQLQGLERTAVGCQQVARRLQTAALVRR